MHSRQRVRLARTLFFAIRDTSVTPASFEAISPNVVRCVRKQAATELSMQVASDVIAVELDPAYRVLRWTPEYRAEAAAILPYTRADIALNYGRNDEAAAGFQSALTALTNIDTVGLRARLERGMGDADLSRNVPKHAVTHYRRALAATPQVPEQLPELLVALADAYRLVGNERAAATARTCAAETTRQLWADLPVAPCTLTAE